MFDLFKLKQQSGLTTLTNSTNNTNNTATTNNPIPEGTTLEQLKSELLVLVGQENANHHRIGQIYNYIVTHELAEAAGFKDAKDFMAQTVASLSQSTLSAYGAVAEAFTEQVTRRYGVTCLYLLLTYEEAADIPSHHEEPGDTLIEVPDAKNQVSTLPFKACSVEQMRRALLRKRKPASSKPLPPEAQALAEQYRQAVAGRFPKGKGTLVKVRVRNHKGKAVLDFTGIPLEQVELLLQALQEQQAALRQ